MPSVSGRGKHRDWLRPGCEIVLTFTCGLMRPTHLISAYPVTCLCSGWWRSDQSITRKQGISNERFSVRDGRWGSHFRTLEYEKQRSPRSGLRWSPYPQENAASTVMARMAAFSSGRMPRETTPEPRISRPTSRRPALRLQLRDWETPITAPRGWRASFADAVMTAVGFSPDSGVDVDCTLDAIRCANPAHICAKAVVLRDARADTCLGHNAFMSTAGRLRAASPLIVRSRSPLRRIGG